MSERQKYSFQHDFGAGTDVYSFKGAKGKKGQLIDYGIEGVTETFTNTTTAGSVAVGNSSDPDAYGDEIGLGTTAADTVGSVSARTLATDPADLRATYILEPDLPADTAIYLTCTAPTGGTPAGIAAAFAIVDWQD